MVWTVIEVFLGLICFVVGGARTGAILILHITLILHHAAFGLLLHLDRNGR